MYQNCYSCPHVVVGALAKGYEIPTGTEIKDQTIFPCLFDGGTLFTPHIFFPRYFFAVSGLFWQTVKFSFSVFFGNSHEHIKGEECSIMTALVCRDDISQTLMPKGRVGGYSRHALCFRSYSFCTYLNEFVHWALLEERTYPFMRTEAIKGVT